MPSHQAIEHEYSDDQHGNSEYALKLVPGQVAGSEPPKRHADETAGDKSDGDAWVEHAAGRKG